MAPPAAAPFKVAFAYVGPIGDGGWSYAHEQGRRAVKAAFGDRVSATYVESVPEGPAGERVFRDMVSRGHSLIFGTSFGYMEPMLKVASEAPNVKFEHALGYKQAPNLRTYDSRTYEGAYMAGVIAGAMSRSHTLGVVASIPIPEVVGNINSFTLGAQSINPKVRVRVRWVNKWFDPANEARAAQSLLDGGADVLFQTTDSSAVLKTAETAGKYAFGWGSDMSGYGPKAHLASAIINWGPYYVHATQAAMEGRWTGGSSAWWGVKEGAIDIVSVSDAVPRQVKKQLEVIKAGLKADSFKIWAGPIQGQNGRDAVKAGQVADDNFLRRMNFFVKGVEDKLPTGR